MKQFIFFLSLVIFNSSPAKESVSITANLVTDNEKNTVQIFQKTAGSVVSVSNIQVAKSWDYGEVEVPAGAGSGMVWDTDGHIVTNFHVIEGGDSFLVSFQKDQKQYKAKLVGTEPKHDIAVLELIEKPGTLNPIEVGTSSDLVVGQKTLAIGNAYGLDHTLTEGIVSALERKIDGIGGVKIYGMIQTDASINPGNSGGPLINSKGQLIGMNTIIISKSGSSAGVGFAVPVDTIKRIVPQIIKHGKVVRPGLGIGVAPDQIKYRFGIEEGVVISYIDPKGPAAKAGLKGMSQDNFGRIYLGDIILEINGKKTSTFDELFHILDEMKIGTVIEVTYLRKNKTLKTKITLTKI